MSNFQLDFDKTINKIRVRSYGGGSPRWSQISSDNANLPNLSMDEVRVLRDALNKLLDLANQPQSVDNPAP